MNRGPAGPAASGLPVLVAGAGPAGLTAALTLARAGRAVVLAERDDGVGGLARTIERDGYRFDIGGHRFFTRVPEVQALWTELLGDDMLERPRRSRILYKGRYFDYPITAGSALAGLGPVESARILASAIEARLRPIRPEVTFSDWVTNRFGRRLFESFFRTYTEKVWGMRCEEIGAQWAAQRIRGLSLRAALADMLRRGSGGQRTLVTRFQYPRLGPGLLWERMRERIEAHGGRVMLRHRLSAVHHERGQVRVVTLEGPAGPVGLPVAGLISSIPLRDLAAAMAPSLPAPVGVAAHGLRYRGFLAVAVILQGGEPFPDTWLYLHDPAIRAGRIQNFRAWSPELLPRGDRTCLGLEYFCWAGDELWRLGDQALLEVAAADLAALGFARRSQLLAGHVVRMAEAYPVYDEGFAERLRVIREGLAPLANLVVAGRNGMHRYNNMDHAMLTGLLAARSVMGEPHDTWGVNADDHHLEPSASPDGAPAP